MEWIQSLEVVLASVVGLAELLLQAIAVSCVVAGVGVATAVAAGELGKPGGARSLGRVRLRFGGWLALALEFQLGADILATTVAPTLDALVQLGAIAAIRTFLNYFLQRELEAEARLKEAQGTSRG